MCLGYWREGGLIVLKSFITFRKGTRPLNFELNFASFESSTTTASKNKYCGLTKAKNNSKEHIVPTPLFT